MPYMVYYITHILLKGKIQPSKFEDIIGFIKQFLNQIGFHLAPRKSL